MSDTSYFDTKAADWDTPERRALANAVADSIIRNVPLDKEMTALDYGAGTGLVTLRICAMVKKIFAADSSPEMIALLAEKIKSAGIGNVEAVLFDIRKNAPPDSRLDLIFSSMTLHHLEDTAGTLAAFREILVPGGIIALADLDTEEGDFHSADAGAHHRGFDRQSLKKLCRETGFKSVETDTAYRFYKTSAAGKEKEYSVFLLTAAK